MSDGGYLGLLAACCAPCASGGSCSGGLAGPGSGRRRRRRRGGGGGTRWGAWGPAPVEYVPVPMFMVAPDVAEAEAWSVDPDAPSSYALMGGLGDAGEDQALAAFKRSRDAARAALARGDTRAVQAQVSSARFFFGQMGAFRSSYGDEMAYLEQIARGDVQAVQDANASRARADAAARALAASRARGGESMLSHLPGAVRDEATGMAASLRRALDVTSWSAPAKVAGGLAAAAVLYGLYRRARGR